MKKYKYVFVVLTYRNTDDILDLLRSIENEVSAFKVIIVNSFYDDKSKKQLENIAKDYGCDFINVENKGYGYGNNRGIDFAKSHYDFEYLIVSNPDIEIIKLIDEDLSLYADNLIGPVITAASGKSQNPYWVFENNFFELLIYLGYKHRSRLLLFVGIAINKIIRELFLAIFRLTKITHSKVFALHGSFVIFPRNLIERISAPIYDEQIFLFSEEADLAHKLKSLGVKSVILRDIVVNHKEDGSMKLAKIDEKSELRKSVMYYYSKHHLGDVK